MLYRRTIRLLPPKKGKVKFPLFCGNVERVITIYVIPDGRKIVVILHIYGTRAIYSDVFLFQDTEY